MGIRIHTAIGYGLYHPKGIEHLLNNDSLDFLNKKINIDLVEWIEKNEIDQEKINLGYNLLKNSTYETKTKRISFSLKNAVILNNSHDTATTLLIQPLSRCKDWRRFDDDIEHTIHSYKTNGMEDKTTILERGFFPWDFIHVNNQTGNKLTTIESGQYRNAVYLSKLNKTKLDKKYKNISPQIPEEVIWLAEYSNLFKNKKDILKLKPVHMVYWE